MFKPKQITIKEAGSSAPYHWLTQDDLEYQDEKVKQPFRTDLASVPQPFTWLIPRYGLYTKAAIFHDHQCQTTRDRFTADRKLLKGMEELGVPWLRKNLIWSAVNWAAIVGHLFKNVVLTLLLVALIWVGVGVDLLGSLSTPLALAVWILVGVVGVAYICGKTTNQNTYWAVPRGLFFTVIGSPFILISIGLGIVLLVYLIIENPKRLILSIFEKLGEVGGVVVASSVAKAKTAPLPSRPKEVRMAAAARPVTREDMTPTQKRTSNLFAPLIPE